jgi:hypothetical protein
MCRSTKTLLRSLRHELRVQRSACLRKVQSAFIVLFSSAPGQHWMYGFQPREQIQRVRNLSSPATSRRNGKEREDRAEGMTGKGTSRSVGERRLCVFHLERQKKRGRRTRIEMILPPPEVVREAVQERLVLQDHRPICRRPPTEARYAAVHVRTRCDLDVAYRESEGSERFPHGKLARGGLREDDLRGANTPDLSVFEAGEDEREHRWRPERVVVGEDLSSENNVEKEKRKAGWKRGKRTTMSVIVLLIPSAIWTRLFALSTPNTFTLPIPSLPKHSPGCAAASSALISSAKACRGARADSAVMMRISKGSPTSQVRRAVRKWSSASIVGQRIYKNRVSELRKVRQEARKYAP